MAKIVYASGYNIGFAGMERFHPFDLRKYGRVWQRLRQEFGTVVRERHLRPAGPVSLQQLLLVHSETYLEKLRNPLYLAGALEVPQVAKLPRWLVDFYVLRPMRWATAGTILAAETALEEGMAINLGGGFHHAKPERGEGFCVYSDIGVSVAQLRSEGRLKDHQRVVYIDTDAHQGNGVCHVFRNDSRVFLFDIFNRQIYPAADSVARERIDCAIPVLSDCSDDEYLGQLERRLPPFLDSVTREEVGLAIYNAGTDVVKDDPLGQMNLSPETVFQRDMLVMKELRERGIPTLMVLSGGYTRDSCQLVARSVAWLLQSSL